MATRGRRREAPRPALRLDHDLRSLGRDQRALPHLVAALRTLGDREIVGDEEEAESLGALQLREQLDHIAFAVFVEVAGRLVRKQQRRRIDERTGDHHSPLLAAGHGVGVGIGAVRQADAGKKIMGAGVGRPRIRGAAQQRGKGDVVDRGQIGKQTRELENKADAARANGRALRLRQCPDIGAVEQDFAFARLGQRAEHGHERRFAGTGAADDRDELARAQLEARAAHGLVAGRAPVSLGQELRRQRHRRSAAISA